MLTLFPNVQNAFEFPPPLSLCLSVSPSLSLPPPPSSSKLSFEILKIFVLISYCNWVYNYFKLFSHVH